MQKQKMTNWIWVDNWQAEDKEEPALVLFRKILKITYTPKEARIQISADSRYKLYINGQLVEVGPSRGDRQVWFFDEIDIIPYISEGENVFAVQVLRYPLEHAKGNHGIFRTEYPGLFVNGYVKDDSGKVYSLNADQTWKGRKDSMFHIVSESDIFSPLQIFERRYGDEQLKGWMETWYDDTKWKPGKVYEEMNQAVSPGNLQKRTIPYMYRKKRKFKEIMVVRQSTAEKQDWEELLWNEKILVIPAHTKEIVEISAGEEMTGYLNLAMQRGRGAEVTLLQSESYVQEGKKGGLPIKRNRNDFENGYLEGFSDWYHVSGFGTEEIQEEYEPFWFRTFRFIRMEIETKEEPLIISRFDYTETGYPLEVKTEICVSDESLTPIWEISERTLRRCMHETYEDCPFYEQLQYAMDSRSQILYTYSVSADDRLARKCMDDFRRSQRYDGLLNCSYPCYGPNVIPGFSVYYILMIYDHMMYFGDKELLEDHMPAVDGILNYFHRNLNEDGYVKKVGGLNGKARYWSFIDWTKEWNTTTGVPSATLEGAITMESLLYIMGLQYAARIVEYLERKDIAVQYLTRAEAVQEAIRKHCVGKNGMLQDGPGVDQYSQHVQVFAVLTDTIGIEQGRENLKKTILKRDEYAQCSVAMAFYLFRALQKTGLYTWTEELWGTWKNMIKNEVTTCVEDEVDERSDCHAWGSLILYELPSVVLGVQPAKPGYEAVRINPEPGYLKEAHGSVITPRGMVKVRWSNDNEMKLEYEVPENIEVIL